MLPRADCLTRAHAMLRFRTTFRTKTRLTDPANPQGKSTAVIPWGHFCANCPYQVRNRLKHRDSSGACALINMADRHAGEFRLLFDGVKIFGFNYEDGPDASPRWRSRRQPRFRDRPKFHQPWSGWVTVFTRDPRDLPRKPLRGPGWKLRPVLFD